jgi:hypothetical protein
MHAGMAPDPYYDAFRNRFLGVGKNRGVLTGIFYRFKDIFYNFGLRSQARGHGNRIPRPSCLKHFVIYLHLLSC